jgi:ribosomal protein S18 acetylase RimI-like enzyme
MIANDNKLDNPVWFSLSETHKNFSIEYPDIKFYHSDYCPFGAFDSNENISDYIDQYSKLINNFFIVGEKPMFSASLQLKNELICNQMILHERIDVNDKENIATLGEEHADELFQLVTLALPGYFKRKTFLLGDYYGIFKDNRLIAVTGERMKMNRYTEISAVVTHLEHTGKGYAKQLIAHTANHIFDQNKIPYLHVAETNSIAIALYEKLGFKTRRKISFWNLAKTM